QARVGVTEQSAREMRSVAAICCGGGRRGGAEQVRRYIDAQGLKCDFDTSVPRFLVVKRLPLVDEIQSALVCGLDPIRTGRDFFRYTLIAEFRNSGTGRSSNLRVFVLALGNAIHQFPSTCLKVCPISRAAKFFTRLGPRARSAIIRPLRTPRARKRSFLANSCASVTNVNPAWTRRGVDTSRWYFERGSITSARSFSISMSQEK